MICGSLAPGQINEGHLPSCGFAVIALKGNLQDRMRSGTVHVGSILGCDSDRTPEGYDLHQSLYIGYSLLFQSYNIHVLLGIFPCEQNISLVEKIE